MIFAYSALLETIMSATDDQITELVSQWGGVELAYVVDNSYGRRRRRRYVIDEMKKAIRAGRARNERLQAIADLATKALTSKPKRTQ